MLSQAPRTAVLAAALLGALAAPGCRGRERQRGGDEGVRVKEAVEKFLDFGMSNENYDHGKRESREPPAKVRSRVVNNLMSPRLRLELDIELPYDLTGRALENAMLDNARRAIANTAFQAVRVRAWPGPLKRVGGTMGYAIISVDGHGWDGERLGYREAKVMLADGAPKPNALDYKILCALETELERLAEQGAAKPGEKRSAKAKGPRPGGQRAQAEATVARTLGLQVEAVRNAVTKAENYYLKE